MLKKVIRFFQTKSFSDIPAKLTRNQLIKRSRIVFIDDEKPGLINDLIQEGFSVFHDAEGKSTALIDRGLFDLVILDFEGVGKKFGKNQGLDLLKHLKRVNPGIFVLSYSTKAGPNEAEFYRLSDGILNKDAGVAESLEKIEVSLTESFNLERNWKIICDLSKVKDKPEERRKLESKLAKAIEGNDYEEARRIARRELGIEVADELATAILEKMAETATLSLFNS